ncbi:hypothetical protein FA10DRAFT_264225 [Acaromyces ingoldii]|uniref:Response regulatory domain-containing protein n=1 Tax=Acaromyces ingoldii TaxID=215250 RepID=A0A316YY73_9BASI|nr:hypothetical protein FA10DRAFT_264225 [Acaromyces ingoldii]PWN93588.1 hypothetical protein FA10DRAFT_264225 [Acaromyces ingoldii]
MSPSTIDTRTSVVASPTLRPLRILIVDDNHINLSVLSTLLKRRFNHVLDGPPVSVDSGLKAIQLLRTNVFDCILMDIQMPFLSGLETAKRIRASEDGILDANSSAHIVAVTTAVGDEPEAAYRRAGMDGMIGKPVKAHHLQHYLRPLAQEAHHSAQSVQLVQAGELSVMPPLPLASKNERVFYLPSDAATPASRPSICEGADFEKLLRAQTRLSLKKCGAMTLARTGTVSGLTRSSAAPPLGAPDLHLAEESSDESGRDSFNSRSNSASSVDTASGSSEPQVSGKKIIQQPQSPRTSTLRISQRTLSKQIAREVANADLGAQSSDSATDLDDLRATETSMALLSPSISRTVRPRCLHRTSSPGWLITEDMRKASPTPGDDPNVTVASPLSTTMSPDSFTPAHYRPILNTAVSNVSSKSSSDSSDTINSNSNPPTPIMFGRRGSATSTGSHSADSEQSSAVTTPSGGSPSSPNLMSPSSEWSKLFGNQNGTAQDGRDHCRHSSNDTIRLSLPEKAWRKSDAYSRTTRLDEIDPSMTGKRASHKVSARRGLDARHAQQLAESLREMELEHNENDG